MLTKQVLLQTILGKYEEISDLLKKTSYDEIINAASEIIEIERTQFENICTKGVTKAGKSVTCGVCISDLIRNIDKYDWLYEHLEDGNSKEIYTHLIRYRLIPDEQFLETAWKLSINNEVSMDRFLTDVKEELIVKIEKNENLSAVSKIIELKEQIQKNIISYAISLDGVISDLWVVPMLIHGISKDYQYYLRQEKEETQSKTYLYIVLKKVPVKKHKKIKRVVAMAPYERPWSNVELVKDCGLIPYLLYKNHGCEVSMVGAKGGDYPYAKLVEGMKLEFLENGEIGSKVRYILEKGKEIDCLILRGCYATNFPVALTYKAVNPDGVIYVGLDANSQWMDRILWYEEDFVNFMNCCDYIATSCTAMQKHLNEKWPWDIKCIPNGYYDLYSKLENGETEKKNNVNFEKKENIILTVGRLGTLQKATEVLLESFALVADSIPDWSLRLVGNVEESFQDYIKHYYENNPELKDRVTFVGSIEDRNKLNQEYERAKIFALPSRLEGGTPNVIAEALHAGCALALTKFDAYEDALGEESCGLAAFIDNRKEYADILLQLCTNEDLKKLSQNAVKQAEDFYDMEKIVGGLYEQLCI